MPDTTPEISTSPAEPNSVLAWFTSNIDSLPFEGRSAIVDIARMIVSAVDDDDDDEEYRRYSTIVERELLAAEYCDIERKNARVVHWSPDFSGLSRAITGLTYLALDLATECDSQPLTEFGLPAEMSPQIIGDRVYETYADFWLPIPKNILGFNHPRALLHVYVGDMMNSPDLSVITAYDRTKYESDRIAQMDANKIHATLKDRALQTNPYRGTAHTVTIGRGGLVPMEVLKLDHETRETLYLDDHIWRDMDDQMKIFGETGDRLEKANIRTSRGVLLQGWPGCGKTKMVRVYANELSKKGITVIMADTDAARHVQEIIDYAKTFDKAVVVLEDIDSVVGSRGASSLSAFLNALDGVSQQNRIVTIATTNDGTALDPAVVRPGRIDTVIDVSTLNERAIAALIDGISNSAGYEIDAARVAAAVLARTKSVTGAMLEGMILNAMLTNDRLETEELVEFVGEGWKISDPRKNFLGIYNDDDNDDWDEGDDIRATESSGPF